MIEEVVSVELPVHERLVVRKNRLTNEENGIDMPRISIVTGTHGISAMRLSEGLKERRISLKEL